ncbi:MAG TPA: NAD-dependent epimerase/dehydratase family protein [Pseudomonadota bacterium]|jgi:dihydroflavonol-4-reductase|nr:NAD-dependent epimerase/dehydratase family protein [Pseudomonadota bacterium]
MIVAVTGATGFVGSHLISELANKGVHVRALVRRDGPDVQALKARLDSHAPIEFVTGNVLSKDSLLSAFRGVEAVFHLAAHISISRFDEKQVLLTNVQGPKNVAAACLETGVRKLIHFSSVHALATGAHDEPMDETTPLVRAEARHAPAYDRSKSLGEQAALSAAKQGLHVVVVSPSGILGPFDHAPSRIGRTLLDFAEGRFPMLVPGVYNWVDVREVVSSAITALEKGKSGEKYLLTGEVASVRRLAELVAQAGGKKAPSLEAPMWLLKPVAYAAEAVAHGLSRSPLLTPQSLSILQSPCDFRSDKAQRELSHKVRPLAETVADALRFFKETGALA